MLYRIDGKMVATSIREATEKDFDLVFPIKLESKEEERKENKSLLPVKNVKDNYAEYLKLDLKGEWRGVFIALDGNKAVGIVVGKIYRSLRVSGYERRGSISNLYVQDEYRQHGIGQHLMDALMEWFEKKKVKGLTLSIYPENQVAEAIYSNMGFKPFCKMMYKKMEDEGE